MQKKLKYISISFLVLFIMVSFVVSPVRVLSFSVDPVSLLHQFTNNIVNRVSDIIYYMIMQKRYIVNNFTDPNNYSPLIIPEEIEKISVSTTSNINPTSTSPVIKQITPPVVKKTENKNIIAPVPELVVVKSEPIHNQVVEPVIKQTYNNDSDILKYTNIERVAESLKPLIANSYLDKIAGLRADDLFDNQYFEHESPDGKSATELAEELGYGYLLIGENLALGNFDNEEAIVTAWMGSPGHRANILKDRFTELGVAIKQGIYKGENTIIAVQIFGLPLNSCSRPDPASKTLIDEATISIKNMQTQASQMFSNLNLIKDSPGLDKAYYNQKISEYNYYAKKVNDAVASLKFMVDSYNADVAKYNSCIK